MLLASRRFLQRPQVVRINGVVSNTLEHWNSPEMCPFNAVLFTIGWCPGLKIKRVQHLEVDL